MASFIESVASNAREAGGVPIVDGVPADQIQDGVSATELFGDKDRRSGVTFDDLIILPGSITSVATTSSCKPGLPAT